MKVQSIGLAGLEKAQEKLAAVARKLASANSSISSSNSTGDLIELSADMTALLESRQMTQTNLKLVETANELASQTIDVLG